MCLPVANVEGVGPVQHRQDVGEGRQDRTTLEDSLAVRYKGECTPAWVRAFPSWGLDEPTHAKTRG